MSGPLRICHGRASDERLEQLARIWEALLTFDGDRSKAAEKLGISRSTLYRHCQWYDDVNAASMHREHYDERLRERGLIFREKQER